MDLGAWLGALTTSAIVAAVVAVGLGVVLGVALSSYGRMPVAVGVAVAVLVPVLGPLVLMIVATVREVRRARAEGRPVRGVLAWSIRSVPRSWRPLILAGPVVAAIGLLIVLAVPAVMLRPFGSFPVSISVAAVPYGLTSVLLSVLVVLLCTVLSYRRPTRLGAIAIGSIGAFWAAASAVVLVLSVPLVALFAQVGALTGTAPGRLLLQWLPTVAPQLGEFAKGANETLSARMGAAPWIALVAGLLLECWAIAEVLLARRIAVGPATLRAAPEPVALSVAPSTVGASPVAQDQEFRWL